MGLRKMTWCTQNTTLSFITSLLWYFHISCFILISCLFFILRGNKYEINKIQLQSTQPRSQVHFHTRLSPAVREEPGNKVESHVLTLPLPSSRNPHFQNDTTCTTFLVKINYICMRMKNHFHIKG